MLKPLCTTSHPRWHPMSKKRKLKKSKKPKGSTGELTLKEIVTFPNILTIRSVPLSPVTAFAFCQTLLSINELHSQDLKILNMIDSYCTIEGSEKTDIPKVISHALNLYYATPISGYLLFSHTGVNHHLDRATETANKLAESLKKP